MNSRRDAVQAYSFAVRRLRAGMVHGEPDGLDPGSTRTWRGVVVGIVLALVLGAGIAIYGLIKPSGGASWRTPGTLVVASDTSARYLYLDGLHPVLNQTSARLLAGSSLSVATVSSGDLASTAQGAPVGIVGAPDSVPAGGALRHGTWLACSTASTGQDGAASTVLTVRIDSDQLPGRGLTSRQAVLVATPDGTQYLVWSGRRLRVDAAGHAPAALGYGSATPVEVPAGFVDALPAGPDLAAPLPQNLGDRGAAVAGSARRIGALFRDGSGQSYVLTDDGLRPVTATESALLRGNPVEQKLAYGGRVPSVAAIGPSDVPPGTSSPLTDLPATPPAVQQPDTGQAVCAATDSVAGTVSTSVTLANSAAVVSGARTLGSQPGVQPGCEQADAVAVASGSGTLIAARSGAGGAGGTYLVAGDGVKYPVPAAGLAQLGYTLGEAQSLPGPLLRLLPTGPSLDPSTLLARGIVTADTSAADCG